MADAIPVPPPPMVAASPAHLGARWPSCFPVPCVARVTLEREDVLG